MMRRSRTAVLLTAVAVLGACSSSAKRAGAPSSQGHSANTTNPLDTSPPTSFATTTTTPPPGTAYEGSIQSDWQIPQRDLTLQAGEGVRIAVAFHQDQCGFSSPESGDVALAVDPRIVVASSLQPPNPSTDVQVDADPGDYFLSGRPGYTGAARSTAWTDPAFGLILADAQKAYAGYNHDRPTGGTYWVGGRTLLNDQAYVGAIAPFTGTYHIIVHAPAPTTFTLRYETKASTLTSAPQFDPSKPSAPTWTTLAGVVDASRSWLLDNNFYRFHPATKAAPDCQGNSQDAHDSPSDYVTGPALGIYNPHR